VSGFIWWIGVAHLVAYAAVGAFILITLATMKVHMWFKIMSRIIAWHIARARWSERKDRGFVETEPKP
jgi:hypothetical protein